MAKKQQQSKKTLAAAGARAAVTTSRFCIGASLRIRTSQFAGGREREIYYEKTVQNKTGERLKRFCYW